MMSYLSDKEFLKQLDIERQKTQYIRITILDFKTEQPIAAIEGKTTGGSINLNGSSNMRRVMSCSLLVDPNGIFDMRYQEEIAYNNITEVENLISLNKKAKAEIGFINTLAKNGLYPDYNIIWLPLGVYAIKSANISKNNSGVNMSLNFNDKTAFLNGDLGGTIPAATILSESELYNADATKRIIEPLLIKDLIKYLVVDFGGEDPNNVIIEDVPDTIRKVVKWVGKSSDLYYYEGNNDKLSYFSTQSIQGVTPTKTFTYGEDCGYMVEPFHYPGKLECNAGETVAAMLDKIKNALGNYEWFYDVFGKFHFQEKKNYLNNSFKPTSVNNINDLHYLSTMNMSKNVYTFDLSNRHLLTNISNNPQYQNIKNDFIVWGTKKTATGADKPIRYHLAFQSKPNIKEEARLCIVYTDYRGLQQVIVLDDNNSKPEAAPKENYEEKDKKYYYYSLVEVKVEDEYQKKYMIEHWDEENQCFRVFENWELCYLKTDDWRTELYFQGLESNNKTFAKNPYMAELNAEWPKIYDVKGGGTIENEEEVEENIPVYNGAYRNIPLSDYEYFLDFLSAGSAEQVTSQFNIDKIGRRSKISSDNSANCIFSIDPPNILIISADGDTEKDYKDTAAMPEYEIIQVEEEIFSNLAIGGNTTSAYDKMKELLVQHTIYNEAITLTTIPIYYLEPNTRIHIEDNDTAVNGDYLINTISLPLGIGTSNISCTRCLERTI